MSETIEAPPKSASGSTPLFPAEDRQDELLRRLSRLELLLVGERMDLVEGNEPTGEEGALEAGVLEAAALPLAARFEQFIDGLGFPNFRGAEFTPYWSRVRNGVRNSAPPERLWANIVPTLAVLQRFRTELGRPVQLLSTYRSPDYNRAVGGATGSMHKEFRAIDFTVSAGNPTQWAKILRGYRGQRFRDPHRNEDFRFRGGIGIYTSSNFVHVDTRGHDVDW
ncbi:MAG TPA: D-Ala-D-Ala carboxypeptidase family metallohydrolase [Longimicrobium sp.]|nr:D-Ala-D-Ala carboxypeptidase family metallohydrolase [Longimicrobium sp.]